MDEDVAVRERRLLVACVVCAGDTDDHAERVSEKVHGRLHALQGIAMPRGATSLRC